MPELTRFQDALSAAIAGDDEVLAPWWVEAEAGRAGLAVYRNTVARGLGEVILAAFPTVAKVVGEDWLRAAGRRFAASHPPAEPSLIAYGAAFPDWLAAFPPAADMPFLADLARLDRAWTEAHLAADATPVGAEPFQALAPEDFLAARAVLHPSLRLLGFDDGAARLWLTLREAETPPQSLELDDAPSQILILRPHLEVITRLVPSAVAAFLQHCLAGQPLAEAAAAALEAEPGADFAALFADLIAAGVFIDLSRET